LQGISILSFNEEETMSLRTRAVALTAVTAAALTVSGTASAAFGSPRLFASQPEQANRVNLLYTQSTADDPVARIVHHVPVPYRTNIDAKVTGVIGSVVLRGNPIDRVGDNAPNANLVLNGIVETTTADASYTVNNRTVRFGDAARGCLGRAPAEGSRYLVARLKDAGGDFKWDVPIYVERQAAATDFGADATITVCFGAPDVAAGNPNRNPGGFRVREFDLRVNKLFTSPKRGLQRWSTLVTPYQPTTGRVNDAGIVEVQSVIVYPRSVTLVNPVRTKLAAKTATFRFGGVVTTAAVDKPKVSLFRGFNRVNAGAGTAQAYTIRTGAGRYAKTLTVKRAAATQTYYFQVRAFAPNVVQGRAGCADNYHPNVRCIQTTRAGYMVRSRTVAVRVPGVG
jgi:hypothetical protein